MDRERDTMQRHHSFFHFAARQHLGEHSASPLCVYSATLRPAEELRSLCKAN